MTFQTLMANIITKAHHVGMANAHSMKSKEERAIYAEAYGDALLQVSLDLGVAFKRMEPEIKRMEVLD